jgi:hypothetical protein
MYVLIVGYQLACISIDTRDIFLPDEMICVCIQGNPIIIVVLRSEMIEMI